MTDQELLQTIAQAAQEGWEELDLTEQQLTALPPGQPVTMYACGPTPMLKAVGQIAEEFSVPAELSMDEHMCCGVGVCLTCVIPIKAGEGWEYQRTCTEGPVFDSQQILWEVAK
jgi:dihydroorotate dehydrogenase electron transfer subunit